MQECISTKSPRRKVIGTSNGKAQFAPFPLNDRIEALAQRDSPKSMQFARRVLLDNDCSKRALTRKFERP